MATIASNDVKTNIHLSFSPEMPLFSITFSGDCILINFLYTSDYILLITMVCIVDMKSNHAFQKTNIYSLTIIAAAQCSFRKFKSNKKINIYLFSLRWP